MGLTVDPTIDPTVEITGQPVSRTHASGRLPRYMRRSVWSAWLPMVFGLFIRRYQGNRATICQYIDTTRKAIDCATTLPLTVFI